MEAGLSSDSDRLHYFRMPYGGRCRRNRKEQLSAPGFWLAVSCRRIRSSLRSAVSTDLQARACGSVRRRRYGSIALVSSGSGAGSAFGVTPSILRRPSGHTISLTKRNSPLSRPSQSHPSGLASPFESSPLNAELFSTARRSRYETMPPSPPARSAARRIASFRATVTLLPTPFGLPFGLPDCPG